MSEDSNQRKWHFDKGVPIVLLSAILFQALAIVWYASHEDAKIEDHERRLVIEETALTGPAGLSERMARVEVSMGEAQKSLTRIETKIDVAATVGSNRR